MSSVTRKNVRRCGAPERTIMGLLATKQWNMVQLESKRDPLALRVKVKVNDFYPDQDKKKQQTKVLPIHQAVKYGAPVKTLELLHHIYSDDCEKHESPHNRLALHIACIFSSSHKYSLDMITILLQHNRQAISEQDVLGRLPIHYAIKHFATYDVIIKLINEYPKSLLVADTNGWLPIHVACYVAASSASQASRNDWVDIIKLLLCTTPSTVHMKTTKGNTVLQFAKASKQSAVITAVEYIIQHTANTKGGDDTRSETTSITHTMEELKL